MKRRKKIGIDLDATLNNLHDTWLELYNKDYNDNLGISDMIKWDIQDVVKPECGSKIFNYLLNPGLFYDLSIVEGAKEVVEFLAEHYDLYITTAYTAETCLDKTRWVQKQKLSVYKDNIIFINNKSLLDVDYLIDDGPHNFKDFKGIGVIFDMPYNKTLSGDKLVRCKGWHEIKDFFESEIEKDKNTIELPDFWTK